MYAEANGIGAGLGVGIGAVACKDDRAACAAGGGTIGGILGYFTGGYQVNDIARTYRPITRSYSYSARTYSPATRSSTPVVRTYSPATRSSTPVVRTYSPATRSSTPVVRTYSPATRSSTPVVRTYSPATRSSTPVVRTYSSATRSSTPVVHTYSPVTRSSTPVVRTYSPPHNIPQFPWPPPHPSAYSLIPSVLLPNLNNQEKLRGIAKKLETAFDQAGYSQRKYYQVPDGFALVSQLEQFNPDGSSKTPPDRWVTDYLPPKIFSLSSYIKALFTANPGRYRIIAFIVTSQPFKESKKTVTREEAMAWLDDGMVILPESIAKQPYTDKHYCTAYIYEFEQTGKEKKPLFKPLSNLTGKDHMIKSKLWASLKQ